MSLFQKESENEPVGRTNFLMNGFGLRLSMTTGNLEMAYCFWLQPLTTAVQEILNILT